VSYHARLAALTLERQPEIDVLSRKLTRQAIASFLESDGDLVAVSKRL
jgi:hypothetical protein